MALIIAETPVRLALEKGLADVSATYIQFERRGEIDLGEDEYIGDRVVIFGWFSKETAEADLAQYLVDPRFIYVQLPVTIDQLRQAAQPIETE